MSEAVSPVGGDPAGNPASPEKTYRMMESRSEALAAINQVVALARTDLRIFDANPLALRERGFAAPSRVESLRNLLLANREHRIRIALHDTRGIEAELPRLVMLLAQFSGQLAIHRTLDAAAEARDPMIIADQAHFWRKPYIDHPRSMVTLHDQGDTAPFIERFEQIWEKSELAVSGSTLGL